MAHHLFQTANFLGLQLYDLVLVTDRHPCRREVITGWLLLRLFHHALLPFWIRGCEMPLPRMNKIVTDRGMGRKSVFQILQGGRSKWVRFVIARAFGFLGSVNKHVKKRVV